MDLWLKDKVAIVTGSSRGIGRSIAELFGEEGAKVVVNYLRSDKLAQEVAAKIKESGGDALVVQCNVENRDEVEALVKKTLDTWGQIDILVNNAGGPGEGDIRTITLEAWRAMMKNHLDGMFNCTKAVIEHMIERRSGKIVNIASFCGMGFEGENEHYAAAKAGQIGFTRTLAKDVGKYNINVNAVSPGNIVTDLICRDWLKTPKLLQDFFNDTPFKRLPGPEEIGHMAVFLASERARHITGINVNVTGGQLIAGS